MLPLLCREPGCRGRRHHTVVWPAYNWHVQGSGLDQPVPCALLRRRLPAAGHIQFGAMILHHKLAEFEAAIIVSHASLNTHIHGDAASSMHLGYTRHHRRLNVYQVSYCQGSVLSLVMHHISCRVCHDPWMVAQCAP